MEIKVEAKPSELDEMERYLIEMIQIIQRDYQKQIEPYVKRLAELRSLRPHPFVVTDVTQEMLEKLKQG